MKAKILYFLKRITNTLATWSTLFLFSARATSFRIWRSFTIISPPIDLMFTVPLRTTAATFGIRPMHSSFIKSLCVAYKCAVDSECIQFERVMSCDGNSDSNYANDGINSVDTVVVKIARITLLMSSQKAILNWSVVCVRKIANISILTNQEMSNCLAIPKEALQICIAGFSSDYTTCYPFWFFRY